DEVSVVLERMAATVIQARFIFTWCSAVVEDGYTRQSAHECVGEVGRVRLLQLRATHVVDGCRHAILVLEPVGNTHDGVLRYFLCGLSECRERCQAAQNKYFIPKAPCFEASGWC